MNRMESNRIESNSEKKYKQMIETPIPRVITALAIPTTLSQLITTIYNTADTYFVSQIGTSATAAVGVVFSLMAIIQAVGFGLGMGASSLISRNLGQKDVKSANRYASSAFFAAVLFGICLMLIGLFFTDQLMRLLGSTETMLSYAGDYGRYILAGAPIMCSAYVLNNVLRSEGEAMLAMWGLCTGGILNMLLDPLFIFGFGMGISGAAIATVLSQLVSFVILLSMFLRKKSIVKLSFRDISRSGKDYIKILQSGFPTICRQALGSVATACLNIQASAFGDGVVAAVTISNKIYMLVRNLVLGIGQGFQPVAGYNYGAGKKRRVRESFLYACKLGTIICTVVAVILAFRASTVITWFRNDDAEVVRIGTQSLYYACLVMPLMAFSTYVNQLYQCLGFSKQATFLASCRQGICFLPIVFLFPNILGITGVAMAQPVADLITFIISVPFLLRFFREHLNMNFEGKN